MAADSPRAGLLLHITADSPKSGASAANHSRLPQERGFCCILQQKPCGMGGRSFGKEYLEVAVLEGFVEHIIFRNEENGYTVLNLISQEDEITCVGIFSVISEGESVELTGEYTSHPSYGEQFKVESFQPKAPEDELSIERYLGSGAIRGVGAALAARIVRHFGPDTFRIIEEEPERLAEIKGISQSQ